jgi:tellurite resistance protein
MANNPHLNILVQLAKIDGETDGSELDLIRQIGVSENISDKDIDHAIETTEIEDSIPSLEDFTDEQKIDLMTSLVLVMKIDGIVHKEEMKFSLRVIKKLGYGEDELFDLVSSTYSQPNMVENEGDIRARAKALLNK